MTKSMGSSAAPAASMAAGQKAGSSKGPYPVAATSVLAMVVIAAVGLSQALRLEPPAEQERWFPDDHMFTGINDELATSFATGTSTSFNQFKFVWGIERLDRSNFDSYRPNENRGRPVFDPNFDLANNVSVRAVLDTCAELRAAPCEVEACTAAKMIVRPGSLVCFMEHFSDPWLKQQGWAEYNVTDGADATRTGVWWRRSALGGGYQQLTAAEFDTQLRAFRLGAPSPDGLGWEKAVGYLDDGFVQGTGKATGTSRLRYVYVNFISTAKMLLALRKKEAYRDTFFALDDALREAQPAHGGMRTLKGIGVSPTWRWYATEQGLAKTFLLGVSLAVPIAFVVLLFATRHPLTAIAATLSIGGIVCAVLGTAFMLGWNMGVAESIAGIIIIGFSVDYVVHLGHMYKHAEVHSITARKGRFEFSALNMGGTVVGGALTTMGAAVMMLGCQLLFFTKMAGLILATICFSFMFSLGFFMPLALIAGPEQAACNSTDAPPVNQPADPAAHVSEVTASEPGKVLQIRAAADV